MASTGCGKTLANARIAHALAAPQHGMRLTYALGLRTLTLQTGRSYRQDLHLGEDELAIRVGGSASRALFDYYEQQAEARIPVTARQAAAIVGMGPSAHHTDLGREFEGEWAQETRDVTLAVRVATYRPQDRS